MEGRNPSLGCGVGCKGMRCGWVPFPRTGLVRRDALVDAFGITDNPCDRPARCPPCCKPTPKFRLPQSKPLCDINCYRREQVQSKIQDYFDQRQEYIDRYCPPPPPPDMIIESLDPHNCPIGVELPQQLPPEEQWFLKDLPCRTNIIAGFFNPNDNKTPEQVRREQCDRFYRSCGPNLPMYPCRGVLTYPRQGWVSMAEELKICLPPGCEDTEFNTPEYIEQQQAFRNRLAQEKVDRQRAEKLEKIRRSGYVPPHPCCGCEHLSQTPYCNDCTC